MLVLCFEISMSFAAGAFSSGAGRGGGGGGGDGPRRLFSRIKEQAAPGGKDGKDGSGPSPITAQLMFQAMTSSMSPGGLSSGSANREHAKDQNDHQLLARDHEKKHHETDIG